MDREPEQPVVIVIGGPNGAGKSTLASPLIPPSMEFVNADEVAKELRGDSKRNVDVAAGRLVLRRLDELEAERQSFEIVMTLASRSLAPRLHFVWVPSPDLSIARVAERVRAGGHYIPDDVVRRRYQRGIANFMTVFRPLAHRWRLYDNSQQEPPRLLAQAVAQTGPMSAISSRGMSL